ncbi:MAG: tetratricopeptide repeat protein [Endomicrobium sp.]|jgi:tetratricopeptide (TPR) repeat protein|nr:tetratricopeptide repeat protein [Endomicrobium sp.]
MTKFKAALMIIALMIVTVLAFYPVLSADFVYLDDPVMIEGNWKINSFTLSNLKSLLFESHFRLYHPMVNLSLFAETALFGKDPYFYHADNLILHLLNSLLVFFIFFLLTKKNFFTAFIVASIFACHPVNVESVAWVTGRKDVLYAFFFLLSLLFYLKFRLNKDKNKRYYGLSLIFFIFSCLSKSMAVTLPAVLILFDWFLAKDNGFKACFYKTAFLKYIPFFAAAAAFSYITYSGYYFSYEKAEQTSYSMFVNFISAHFNILFYAAKFVNPSKLSVIYPYFFGNVFPPKFILYSPALIYGVLVLILFSLKDAKKIFFGAALFLTTVLPVINVFPTGIAPVADRYVYIPFLGFAYLAAEFVMFLFRNIKTKFLKNSAAVAVCAVFALMCVKTNIQASVWHNTETLFNNQIKNYNMQIAHAYTTRGIFYFKNKMNALAQKDFVSALTIDSYSTAAFSLAQIRWEQKKYAEAIRLYLSVSKLDPNFTLACCHLSKIYSELNDKEKSLLYIKKALETRINPTYIFAYYNAGKYYENAGDDDKAMEYYFKALKFFPQDAAVYSSIGGIYEKKGDYEKAVQIYYDGLAKSSNKILILGCLSNLFFERGLYDAAENFSFRILAQDPNDYYAYERIGSARAIRGDYKSALAYFTAALLIKNDLGSAYFHRAIVHFFNKRYDKAEEDIAKAQKSGFEIPKNFREDFKSQK